MSGRLLAGLLLWCLAALPATAADSIRVGLSASLTGERSELSQLQLRGMQLFVQDLADRGALLGRQIELVVYDDESDTARTVDIYRRLVDDAGIDLLISPYSSAQTLAIRDFLASRNVAMIAVASAPAIWNQPDPRIFGLFTPADENMLPLLELARQRGLKRLALAYQRSDFPEAMASGVRRYAPEYGIDVVFDQSYAETGTDFEALARSAAAAAPEIMVVGAYLEDSVAFAAASKRAGLAPALLAFSGGPALREFGDLLGVERADGILSTVQWMRSVRFPGSFDFGFRYRQQYGVYPSYESAAGYAAMQVLEAAIRLAGSTDPAAVRAQLADLKFRSILGHYRVDAFGRQTAKTTYLVQWQDNHISLVYPEIVARFPLRFPYRP